jgi:hypothetical protein
MTSRTRLGLLAGLLLFSGWSVYTRYVDLHSFDLVTQMPFRDLSMQQYNDTIAHISGACSHSGWCARARWPRRSIRT